MTNSGSDSSSNPFSNRDSDQREIWDILMRRDFEAFVAGNWSMIEQDFWQAGFCGIDARNEAEPSKWRMAFPNVATYRDEWLRQVHEFASVRLFSNSVLQFLYDSCRLEDIEIVGDRAIARKKFNGVTKTTSGQSIVLCFQTLYQMVRSDNRWQIAGFIGYLPNPMPANSKPAVTGTPW